MIHAQDIMRRDHRDNTHKYVRHRRALSENDLSIERERISL